MIMPAKTFHGPFYQKLLDEYNITKEIPCKRIGTILSPYGPDVIEECITYFIGRKYAEWTSDEKTAFKLTANGKAAYMLWDAQPPFDKNGIPKGDFM